MNENTVKAIIEKSTDETGKNKNKIIV